MKIVKMLLSLSLYVTLFVTTGIGGMAANTKTSEAVKVEVETDAMEVNVAVEMNTAIVKGVTWYLVESEEHLRAIGTGQYTLDKNYMQNANITMSENEWVPIGTSDNPFTGNYNGNGFEINGLTITSSDIQVIGFFAYAKNAQLYNITLRELDIENAGSFGRSIGAICALATDCNIHGNNVYSIYD